MFLFYYIFYYILYGTAECKNEHFNIIKGSYFVNVQMIWVRFGPQITSCSNELQMYILNQIKTRKLSTLKRSFG